MKIKSPSVKVFGNADPVADRGRSYKYNALQHYSSRRRKYRYLGQSRRRRRLVRRTYSDGLAVPAADIC
jgi:hypothetical protein